MQMPTRAAPLATQNTTSLRLTIGLGVLSLITGGQLLIAYGRYMLY